MGAGNLVGALLSGVVAVPGVLIGSGVGAIHGPFVKLKDSISGNGKKEKDEEESFSEEIKAEVDHDTETETETETETDEDAKAHAAIVEAARNLNDEKSGEGDDLAAGAHDDASQSGVKPNQSASRSSDTEPEMDGQGDEGDLADAEKDKHQPETETKRSS